MRRVSLQNILGVVVLAILVGWAGEAPAASAESSAGLSRQVVGGGVTVIATLLKDQGETTAIKLALETHSVNLDGYKWEAIAALHDDGGKTYSLQAVENGSGGGHHRGAILRFSKVAPEAKTIELSIKDVAGVKERTFRWSTTE